MTSQWPAIFEGWCKCTTYSKYQRNNKKIVKNLIFVGFLKATLLTKRVGYGSGSLNQCKDQYRLRLKMSRIRNTAYYSISRTWVVSARGARPKVRLGRAARLIGGLHEHTALDEGGEGVKVGHEDDGVDQLGQGPVGGGGRVRQRLHHTRMKRTSILLFSRILPNLRHSSVFPDHFFTTNCLMITFFQIFLATRI